MAVIVGQGISVSPVADAELSHESTSTVQNKVVTDAIASEYSTSKTYSVGDVCTHDGKLYECIVDIPTAEGWTLSHWKVSNLGDNVSNLNRQLNDVEENQIPELKNAISQKETKTTYTTLSGTTVTQTGEDHVMYLCGELATLSFTAPASGITAIRFSSGTTPTVVTLNGITMPDDWAGAEANKTYEINVLDGKGVYASWS